MKSISLVCTVHEERGLANAAELLVILERIRPDVIFLELPGDALARFFSGGAKSNLESMAVSRYREFNSAELVAVDLPAPDDQFFNDYRYLQERIERKSQNSRRLLTWHRNYVFDHGFAYLNSEHCSKMFADIQADEVETLRALGEEGLARISEQWTQTNEIRESEMLKRIRRYCREAQFARGAFLIGAAHRQSIIEKTCRPANETHDHILWDYSLGTSHS